MRSHVVRYLIGAAAVALATVVRQALDPALGNHLPYVTYFVAVAFVAWYCGLGPSLLAMLAGSYLSEFLFFSPRYALFPYHLTIQGIFGTLTYFMVTSWIIFVCEAMRREQRRAERNQRALLMLESQHKRIDVEMRDSEIRTAAILQSALDVIITMDYQGRIVEFNPAAEQTFGYPRQEAIGRFLADLIIPPRLRDEHWKGLRHFLATGEGPILGRRIEMTAMRASGEEFPVELSINVVRLEGQQPFFTGYLRDITERKRVEEAVRLAEQRFRTLSDGSPVLLWVNDLAGCEFVNRAYLEFLGVKAEVDVRGYDWSQYVHPDDRANYLGEYLRALADQRPFQAEFRFLRADGEYRWMRSEATPRFDASQSCIGYVGATVDITDRKVAEQATLAALDEAERAARMKDEFLATLSHELRTPMTAIHGWAQLLKPDSKSEILQQGIEVIQRNSRLQSQIIEDLLDMSRIVSGKVRLELQPVEVGAVIGAAVGAIKPAADAKEVCLNSICDPSAVTVRGDPARLQQVVYNLLTNAVKFTPAGGTIQVTCKRIDSDCEITVSDTGIGIKAEFLPHVFERFRQQDASTTREYRGLGLGLAIVKHIVEIHGGTVQAQSAGEGKGATFTVRLPVASPTMADQRPDTLERQNMPVTPQPPKSQPLDEFDAATLKERMILVVDDEPDARGMICKLLQGYGATCLSAASAIEALSYFDSGTRPDVVVSDLGMPGMDGYQLVRKIRALPPHLGGLTPAIALTAFARSEDRERSLLAGFQHHLSKPVDLDELLSTIVRLID